MIGFRGRREQMNKAMAASAAPAQIATAGAIPAAAATMPKVTLVVARSALPTNPFNNGTPFQVEFELPASLGKLTDTVAEFSMTFSTADASGCDITVVPSAFFVNTLEVLVGGQPQEVIESPELFVESAQWCLDNTLALNAAMWNINGSTGGLAPSFNLANAAATASKVWYLPLNGNFFSRMAPYVKGITDKISFRLTLAPSITSSVYKTGTSTASSCSIQLTNLRLFCTDEYLGDQGEAAQAQAHQRGVQYKSVIHGKFQTNTFSSIPNTADLQVQLTSLKHDTAAIVVSVRKNSPAVGDVLTHYELSSLGLLDDKGNQLYLTLPAKVIEHRGSTQVPISAVMVNNSPSNNYILGFGRSLQSVLESGRFVGGLTFTSQESVVLRPVASLTDCKVYAVSYDYVTVAVQGGKLSLRRAS